MVKSAYSILAVAAVGSFALVPGVASAATGPPVLAHSSSPAGDDPDTTTTFTVTSGALSMTAPTTAYLGSRAPGTYISFVIGPVQVTDDRALLSAAWTATASATDWTTGAGAPTETIPASDVTYQPGYVFTRGTITATPTAISLSATPTPVVIATDGTGDNDALWYPYISVAVPASAIGGLYTGTMSQSVS